MGIRQRLVTVVTGISVVVALGAVPASVAAADDAVYYLPAVEDTTLVVSQGNTFGRTDHRTAAERYAFDFISLDPPERFPVLAARGGTVIGQRSSILDGRCDEPADERRPDCWKNVNYVLIDHGDGTSGLYMHLLRSDPEVRKGDVVSAGQLIGTAGSTGWTDRVGLQFQVQTTPEWFDVGSGGWFQTRSLPVGFADADVLEQYDDGVPMTDDLVTSSNPGPDFETFRFRRRPAGLAAAVPLGPDEPRDISRAYDVGSPDGYGLHFAPGPDLVQLDPSDPVSSVSSPEPTQSSPGTAVRPMFSGQLAFAGCAAGDSAHLGGTVVIRLEVDEQPYHAILGHLSEIDAALLDVDADAPPSFLELNDIVGRYGSASEDGVSPALECPEADPTATDLFAAILEGGTVSADGEISGGTPVSPEPLVGARGYEGLTWWPGPLAAATMSEDSGNPRGRWNRKSTANTSHVPFGESVRLTARVRDAVDISEVRFRAWYPRWPRTGPSGELVSFEPNGTWRELAACTPRGVPNISRCNWDGDAQDALVTFRWDPTATETADIEAWLPRARTAMSRSADTCVPVSLAVEVVDEAGNVYSQTRGLPRPGRCDQVSAERVKGSRLVYLDPLVPPAPPVARNGASGDRGWPPVYEPDPLNGAIVWRDRSDNEAGFRIFARRSWFRADCSVANGRWREVTEVDADKQRYRPRHNQVVDSITVPDTGAPGTLVRWEYAVASFNNAGTSARVPVGGFVGGSEAFCDLGLEPPPDL